MNKVKIAVSILFILLGFYLMFSCEQTKEMTQEEKEIKRQRDSIQKDIERVKIEMEYRQKKIDSVNRELQKL